MQLPEQIRIGALTYAVEVLPGIGMLEEGRYGLCRAASQRIELSAEIGEGLRIQTFLHEIIHAISFERAIDLKERQVDQLANGLLAFLVDNELI
jgi:hypothetical protein